MQKTQFSIANTWFVQDYVTVTKAYDLYVTIEYIELVIEILLKNEVFIVENMSSFIWYCGLLICVFIKI